MPFDYQPVLISNFVEIRPLCAEHYDDLYAVASDPLIWEQHPVKNRYEESGFKLFFSESLESRGALIITELKSNQVIGSARFHGYNEEMSEVEIGWTFLARAYWGGKYNGEIKKLMLEHAFESVRNVVLLVAPNNFRSQRSVEKIGGVRIGSRRDAGGRASFVYQITASSNDMAMQSGQ